MSLVARNFWFAPQIVAWALFGSTHLKRQLVSRVRLDPRGLLYDESLTAYLQIQHSLGRQIVLISNSDASWSEPVARHAGVFSDVIASQGAGERSQTLNARFGAEGYEFAPDFPHHKPNRIQRFLRAIRVHQWVKNALILLPVLTSHRFTDPVALAKGAIAIIAFSFCASSVYVLNDLLDLPNDRQHSTKRKRPFAAGDLSVPFGIVLAAGFLIGAALTSLLLPHVFQALLAFYFVLTLAYSLSLKRKMLVDIFTLGGLYTLRVLAGSAATGIEPSPWLLAFCLFFFLSLALVKRFTELHDMKSEGPRAIAGRGYVSTDLQAIGSLGTSSGFMCVLVLALYINSPQVVPLYRYPFFLWFLCPVILYWISRVWIMAYRGTMHDDPVLFALKDRVSYITAACCSVILVLAARGIYS